jgi:hypothetical protein
MTSKLPSFYLSTCLLPGSRPYSQIDQATRRRRELPQLDAALSKDLGCLVVDQVALVVYNLSYADLGDLDAARQTGTCVAVEDSAAADTVATCFEQGILFGVETETGREAGASLCSIVAART